VPGARPRPPIPPSPPVPRTRPAPESSPPMQAPPSPSAPPAWHRHPQAPTQQRARSFPAPSSPSSASAFASASRGRVPRRCLRQHCPRPTPEPFGPTRAPASAWAAPAWARRGRRFPASPRRPVRNLSLAPPPSRARKPLPRLQAPQRWRGLGLSPVRKRPVARLPPVRVRADRAAAIQRRRRRQASHRSQAGAILPCPRGPVEVSLSSGHRVGEVLSPRRGGLRLRRTDS